MKIKRRTQNIVMILSFAYAGVCALVFLNTLYSFYIMNSSERNVESMPALAENISDACAECFNSSFLSRRPERIRSTPLELNNVLLLTFFGMIISSACGFTLMDLLGRKDKKEIRETVISEMLPQEEREIIRLLEENGGAMKQSDLVKNSGLKKLKVSRIIKKLELMGVVKKYPHGITNKIALEKRISDDK